MNKAVLGAMLLTALAGCATTQQPAPPSELQAAREVEAQFIAAFNRQDANALAALFAEDAIRVTPGGLIQGRETIRKDFEKRFQSKFHDLAVTMTVTKTFNGSIWEAGEWSMKIGDQPVRGYGAMTLVREGNSFKVRDDTFNMVPPAGK
jgi:ketosteroid isomerase-like protein